MFGRGNESGEKVGLRERWDSRMDSPYGRNGVTRRRMLWNRAGYFAFGLVTAAGTGIYFAEVATDTVTASISNNRDAIGDSNVPSTTVASGSEAPQEQDAETCPTVVISDEIRIDEGEFVSTAVYRVNEQFLASVGGDQAALDPLWANYFSADNGEADPNSPSADVIANANLRQLTSVDNCVIR